MANEADPSDDRVLKLVCKQLSFDFGDQFTEEAIQELVSESLDRLRGARVQTYVPLLLHRSVQARLRAAAPEQGRAQAQAQS